MKAPARKRTVRLIPAIECTHLAAVSLIVQALNIWRRIAQKAVIWVPADRLDVLREVVKRSPLPVIPALKSWHVLGRTDFTNAEKWTVLATAAREACSIVGTRTIAWDHETAVVKYFSGELSLDVAALRRAVRALPRNLTHIWYPLSAANPARAALSTAILAALEPLTVRPVDHNTHGSPEWNNPLAIEWWVQRRATQSPLPIVWFGTFPQTEVTYWDYEAAPEVVAKLKAFGYSDALIYPPGSEAVPAAEAIVRALGK